MGQPSTLLLRALVVDDGELLVRQIVSSLQGAGIALEVERVNAEADFRARLAQSWDVVISDVRMACFEAVRHGLAAAVARQVPRGDQHPRPAQR